MKKYYLFGILFLSVFSYSQNFGDFASGIKINNTIYNTSGVAPNQINSSFGALDFDSQNLGVWGQNSSCAKITGGEIKTWKNTFGNVCSAKLYWRVYPIGNPSGIFNVIPLSTISDCDTSTNAFYDGLGPCSNGDQKWKEYNLNIDFVNGLIPGSYILEIYYDYTGSDASNSTCETTKYISNNNNNYKATFTISNPTTNPNVSSISICVGGNLTLTANPSGGVTPYTFKWTGPNGFTSTAENPVISNIPTLNSGIYSVFITDACGVTSSIQSTSFVTIHSLPTVSAVKTLYNGADLSCSTSTNGVITVTASGGTGTLMYSKDNGSTFQASNIFNGLVAGTYQIVARDTNLCNSLATAVTITAPTAVTIGSAVKTLYNGADLSCSTSTNGIITVTASGGTGTLMYSKDNGSTFQASNIFSGLAAGTYQIVARDTNLCNSLAAAITITAPTIVAISSISSNSPVCSGSTLNFFSTASGGTGTFFYNWSGPNGFTSTSQNPSILNTTTTASGIYSLTVTDSNGCSKSTTTTVTVRQTPVGSASPQTICSAGTSNIALNSTVIGTTFSWTAALQTTPTGGTITGFSNSTGATITQTLTNTGSTTGVIRYTIIPTVNSCSGATFTVDVTVYAASSGGLVSFPNGLNIFTDCHSASGQVFLNNQVGSILYWQSSTNAGSTWSTIGNAGNTTYNYSNVLITTIFRAVVQNATCGIVNSAIATLFVIPNIKPSPVSASPSTLCEGESTTLISNSGFSSSQNVQYGGLFNIANPNGWMVDGGVFSAGGDNGKNHTFLETNGGSGTEYDTTTNDKFAITRGALDSKLDTPIFDLIGLTTASLTFNYACKLNNGAWAKVELSFDGGVTYPVTLATFSANQGPYNQFNTLMTINMNAYLGYSTLRIRFDFHGTEDKNGANPGSSWAIDNVSIPQTPVPTLTSLWKDDLNNVISVTNATNVVVTPAKTTTYAVTSFLNGCTSYGPDGTTYITVTVNSRPTANIGPNQTICYGGTATFSVALTGVAPWNITYSNGTTTTTVSTNNNPYIFSVSGFTTNKTYTITGLSDKNCTSIAGGLTGSAAVTVLVGTPGVWTGLVSTDWFDCKNWQQGLPSSNINAFINSGLPRMPVIDRTSPFAAAYSYIANAQDLIIASGASVTMVSTNNSELQISRDWKNSGVFIPGTGTVTFNGSTLNQIQNINNGIKTNETFYNLTTNNSGSAKGISLVDGFELTVSNNLSLLSGDLRLTGEAQLVQAATTANPTAGSGKLYRDQQGQQNSFNYNYWSSPVSSSADFAHYSVGGVLRDGTDITNVITISNFNQENITFGDGAYFADGPLSNPIKISNRWLWSYGALTPDSNTYLDNYNQWTYIGNTGLIQIGEGFTMKGTGGIAPITATQNYVFVGKPNSGTISLDLILDDTHLIGNPYPSALDADKFIRDNLKDCTGCTASANVFNGALYFWDHFYLSNNHYLAEYEGGYATYTLMGGVNAIANVPLTANNGISGSKIPQRYIPVAQAFFVDAAIDGTLPGTMPTVSGGKIVFKNSQRAFVRENSGNSIFMKNKANLKTEIDSRPKIRLGFDSSIGKHRQILVGVDAAATNLFDIGYDAPMYDTNDDDMFWKISDSQFVIQAISDFNIDRIIPLGIVIANEGLVTIKIDALENIPSNTEIFLFDNTTGIYHPIKATAFTISLPVGEYSNRFSIRFSDQTLSVSNSKENEEIIVLYSNNYKTLIIRNNTLDSTVNSVNLFNMLGQSIAKWNVENSEQTNIQIPIKNISAGIYAVKIRTSKGESSKKIIVN